MLEHVTSCEIAKRSNPIFLVLAALAFVVGGIVSAKAEETAPLIIGIIVAVVFVVFYFATRSQVLAVSSPSSRITIDTKDIPLEKVLQVIDEVEAAKDRRLVAISRT